MKKLTVALTVAAMGIGAWAKDFQTAFKPEGDHFATIRRNFMGFGYACDPKVGGESVALEYRHAGAWVIKTAKCDDATLEFCKQYKIRLMLVLSGDRQKDMAILNHIVEKKLTEAIGGIQFEPGDFDFTDGAKCDALKAISGKINRDFKGSVVAVQLKPNKLPADAMLADQMRYVTHFALDLTKETAPYKTLESVVKKIKTTKIPFVNKAKIIAIAPDRIPGEPEENRDKFDTVMWKFHWLMSAYACEKVECVIFNEPVRQSDFGLCLRYLGLAFWDHPNVVKHGESLTSDAKRNDDDVPDVELDLETEEDDEYNVGGQMVIEAKPKACAEFAAKKEGDVEYLALYGEQRLCVVLVNSTKNRCKMTIDASGRLKTGNSTYRKMTFDPKTGKVKREAHGGYSQPSKPVQVVVAPGCVETCTIVLTTQNFNQAGY